MPFLRSEVTAPKSHGGYSMAFSQYEGDFPELRSAWWKTRSHHAPLGVRTKEYNALVDAIARYEKEVSSKGGSVPETLDGIVASISSLKDAVKGTRDLVVKTKKVDIGVRMAALPLMGSKVFREKHRHFLTALDNLKLQCRNSPYMVPSIYRV